MEYTRESIFVSAVRSFFRSFAALLGILIALVLIVVMIAMFSSPSLSPRGTELVILPDAQGKREMLSDSAPVILQIPIHGEIGMEEITGYNIEKILMDAQEGFLKNNRVKAILLHMDTPGGTVDDSDAIYRALLEYKQKHSVPIYTYVEGICASGGMYISATADKIYSTPSSIIGSIGVRLGPIFNFVGTMDKVGVQALTFADGKNKDELNPFRPWRPDEGDSLRVITQALYERFVDIFSKGRPNVDKEKLVNVYGANVYIAKDALDIGYIDNADASYKQTLSDLVTAAGIEEGSEYQVVELKLPQSIFVELAKGKSPVLTGKVTHHFQVDSLSKINSEFSGKFLYLYHPH